MPLYLVIIICTIHCSHVNSVLHNASLFQVMIIVGATSYQSLEVGSLKEVNSTAYIIILCLGVLMEVAAILAIIFYMRSVMGSLEGLGKMQSIYGVSQEISKQETKKIGVLSLMLYVDGMNIVAHFITAALKLHGNGI